MEVREGYKKTELGWIPEEWKVATLFSIKSNENNSLIDGDWIESPYITQSGIRLIQTGNIGVGYFIDKSKKYISEKSFIELKCKEVRENDILICRLAEPIGRSCIVPKLETKCITSVDVTIFRPNTDIIDKCYIKYFLNFDKTLESAKRLSGGSTRQRINRTNLGKLHIPLPPLPEQQKIAEILTTVDDKISSIEDRIQQTEQLKKGLMEKLLTEGIGHTEFKDTEIGRIPASWASKQMKEVSYGTQNGLYKDKTHYGSGYEMVHMTDIFANEQIIEGEMKKVILSDAEINKYKLLEGDLLFARRSLVPEGSGKCCYVGEIKTCITFESSIIRVSLKKDILHPKFVYFYISSFIGRREMMKYVRQVAVSGISGQDLQKYNLPVPPLSEQNQIANILTTVDDKLDILQSKKSGYETLKKGLMEQLLTGKKRVKV